jgi:hypothetical protein
MLKKWMTLNNGKDVKGSSHGFLSRGTEKHLVKPLAG